MVRRPVSRPDRNAAEAEPLMQGASSAERVSSRTTGLAHAAEHLRRVVRSLPLIIWAVDSDGVFDLFEDNKVLGLPADRFLGHSAFEMWDDVRPDVTEAIRGALAGEERHLIVQGEESGSWWETWYSPLRAAEGRVSGVLGVTMEITERIQREDELRRSIGLLNATLDSISEGVIAVDELLRVRAVNRRFAEMWGLGVEQILEMEPEDRQRAVFDRCVDPVEAQQTAERHTMDRVQSHRGMLYLKDGRQIETLSVPHRAGEEFLGHIISFRDRTEEVRATRLLERQASVLEDIARDTPLQEVLDGLCRALDDHLPGSLASILVVDDTGTSLTAAAAPELMSFYDKVGPVPIREGSGSCGTSAYRNRTVIAEDIQSDPLWSAYREQARNFGLRSCWSVPIKSAGGAVLGTFATYQRHAARPAEQDQRLAETLASLAAVAIERDLAAGRRRALEARLRQAEKMESVGRLAGGLAHDLGNVLSAVTANVEVLRSEVATDQGIEALGDLEAAATMAGRLVDDLLNLMRPARPELVNVDALVLELVPLLDAVSGPDVELAIEPKATHPWVRLDVSQLRQVLLNLAINAKDAMPHGGRLSVTTQNGAHPPGQNSLGSLVLTVGDTGVGMDPFIEARAFEPFFTTKSGSGAKGVGLGLASASAAVARIGGAITCDTAPGKGTRMHLHLPLAPAPGGDGSAEP